MEKDITGMTGMSFEEAKSAIESIIQTMEQGNLPLEESITQFERATELIKYCQEKLDGYRKKIETVTLDADAANGDEI